MSDREFRTAIIAAAGLPSNCGALVLRYVGLFRPATRQLTAARAGKLIDEVAALILADEVKLGHACEHVLAHTWEKALDATLNNEKLTRPLKNHNYLIKVALSMVHQFEANTGEKDPEPMRRDRASTQGLESMFRQAQQPRDAGSACPEPVEVVETKNPLHDLDEDARNALFVKAEKRLVEEGFKPQFIVASMIESMAISLLEGAM